MQINGQRVIGSTFNYKIHELFGLLLGQSKKWLKILLYINRKRALSFNPLNFFLVRDNSHKSPEIHLDLNIVLH